MHTRTLDTLSAALLPRRGVLVNGALVLGASLFVALAAQLTVRLPFSPVPVTGQTFAVLLVGALLGSRLGALALFAYLAEGAAGLPVFAGGAGGVAWLLGPTGGYLLAFVPAAFVVGSLCERGWDRRVWTAAPAMLIGTAIIFAGGLPWLANFVGTDRVFALGFYPFLAGAFIKIGLAVIALPSGWKILGHFRG